MTADDSRMKAKKSADLLDPNVAQALSLLRVEFEASYGPSDPDAFYTSDLPRALQAGMIASDPLLYYRGLPPWFLWGMLGFIKQDLAAGGALDDYDADVIQAISEGLGQSFDL